MEMTMFNSLEFEGIKLVLVEERDAFRKKYPCGCHVFIPKDGWGAGKCCDICRYQQRKNINEFRSDKRQVSAGEN